MVINFRCGYLIHAQAFRNMEQMVVFEVRGGMLITKCLSLGLPAAIRSIISCSLLHRYSICQPSTYSSFTTVTHITFRNS